MSSEQGLPRISVVTPLNNQGANLEATIRSVVEQAYPNLEYILMEADSNAVGSEIVQQYKSHLIRRTSRHGDDQNQAITEGFKHATGEIFAYLTTDDVYLPWTFRTVAKLFTLFPQIQWLTSQTQMLLNRQGTPVDVTPAERYARTQFYRELPGADARTRSRQIQQAATFWRRELWGKAGSQMDASMPRAADFELWARFFQHADLVTTDIPLAGHRYNLTPGTEQLPQAYLQDCETVLKRYPNMTLAHPLQLEMARQIFKWTGRGGQRWGSTIQWVRYNQFQKQWTYHSSYVF